MKKTLTALLCTIWGIFGGLSAQNTTAFSVLQSSTADLQVDVVKDTARQKRADKIYQRLVLAKGDKRQAAPPLLMSRLKNNIAYLEGDGLSIGIEQKAWDILDRFGDDAFAFILGHEVSHFYEKHAYQHLAFQQYQDHKLLKALDDASKVMGEEDYAKLAVEVTTSRQRQNKILTEMEADYLGGFLAYSAGYDISKVPEIFDALYGGYKMDSIQFGYASLSERKQMAKDANNKLQDFIDVFEFANLLTVINRYQDARVMYRYILNTYQSQRLYNNLGVLTALEALELFTEKEMPYHLPLQLDLDFQSNSKGDEADKKRRRALLQEALVYFTNAISMDRDYAPAYLNMACVYFLLGDFERATFMANVEARQKAAAATDLYPATARNADILLALIDLEDGRRNQGIQQLTRLSEKEGSLAKMNLAVANGEPAVAPQSGRIRPMRWTVGSIGEQNVGDARKPLNAAKNTYIFGELQLQKWPHEAEGYKAYRLKYVDSEVVRSPVTIVITDPGYDKTTADGFQVGSKAEDIKARFKQPQRVYPTVNGEIWKYNNHYLFLGADGLLKRWCIVE